VQNQPQPPPRRQIERENALYQIYLHGREGRPRWGLVLAVALLHLGVLAVTIPRFPENIIPRNDRPLIQIRQWIPPPPLGNTRPRESQRDGVRKIAVPDLTPAEPEPAQEVAEKPPAPLDPDADYVLDSADSGSGGGAGGAGAGSGDELLLQGPPPSGLMGLGLPLAGVGGVSVPSIIRTSQVQPQYPHFARQARIEGRVILQAVIQKDGTVGEIEIISVPTANVGFDAAAIAAVRQWRYRPALHGGRPVDVITTIVIDFSLR
jgi:protein TonB